MNKKTTIAVVISIVIVFVLVGGGLISGVFTNNKQTANKNMPTSNQIESKDIVVGTGDVAVAGKDVTVNYTGVFSDGKKFDSSLDRGVPFTFKLGSGMVIKGWDIGVEGMKVGGKRILVIPSQFGYGSEDLKDSSGKVVIPGNSTLIFQIELLGVK